MKLAVVIFFMCLFFIACFAQHGTKKVAHKKGSIKLIPPGGQGKI